MKYFEEKKNIYFVSPSFLGDKIHILVQSHEIPHFFHFWWSKLVLNFVDNFSSLFSLLLISSYVWRSILPGSCPLILIFLDVYWALIKQQQHNIAFEIDFYQICWVCINDCLLVFFSLVQTTMNWFLIFKLICMILIIIVQEQIKLEVVMYI